MDWHEISVFAIKNATIRIGSKNSKIELSSAVLQGATGEEDTNLRPCVDARGKWGGCVSGAPGAAALQAPQGRSDPLYGGTSAPGARATGATDGWWWQHLRAPLGVARLHVLPCLHSREYGSALHRSPQAHPRGPVCEGAPPPRRAPTPRSFGRPAPFVCRSPGQRPTHNLKGSVSEAPAHVSVLLGGACGGGGSTTCVYRWQEQQPGKTWEGQCPSTGRRTLGFSAH